MEVFQEMINLQLLSLEKTFIAMNTCLQLHQKEEIMGTITKIQKIVFDLYQKISKNKESTSRVSVIVFRIFL
jgi:hypothetical protein